jgi:hypothetical protein
MEAKTSTQKKYWIWFFIWLAILIYMLVDPNVRQFFWLALPGTCTYFAKGMDIM